MMGRGERPIGFWPPMGGMERRLSMGTKDVGGPPGRMGLAGGQSPRFHRQPRGPTSCCVGGPGRNRLPRQIGPQAQVSQPRKKGE